jgi:hypothetical protein
MPLTVCLNANTLAYPTGGGHRWVYLNWALGLRASACRVIWMEGALPEWGAPRIRALSAILKQQLRPFGFDDAVAIHSFLPEPLPAGSADGCIDADAGMSADLLIDMGYGARQEIVDRFRLSALIDIDPGIMQLWVANGQVKLPRHDTYFTIGETVGRPGSNLPDLGLRWHYTPPCVSLEAWQPAPSPPGAAFTTVSQWRGGDWMCYGDESYSNEKRDGFLPFLDLPRRVRQPLELALNLGGPWEDDERRMLADQGWHVREAPDVSATPADYHRYIQQSAGEFSCAKPSCVRLQSAWLSDRTLCYLASAKPAVVQDTGPSRFLPDASGLFRFKTIDQAAQAFEELRTNYAKHASAARALAEEFFDAKKVAKRLLEVAIT